MAASRRRSSPRRLALASSLQRAAYCAHSRMALARCQPYTCSGLGFGVLGLGLGLGVRVRVRARCSG